MDVAGERKGETENKKKPQYNGIKENFIILAQFQLSAVTFIIRNVGHLDRASVRVEMASV